MPFVSSSVQIELLRYVIYFLLLKELLIFNWFERVVIMSGSYLRKFVTFFLLEKYLKLQRLDSDSVWQNSRMLVSLWLFFLFLNTYAHVDGKSGGWVGRIEKAF